MSQQGAEFEVISGIFLVCCRVKDRQRNTYNLTFDSCGFAIRITS